MSNDIQHRAFFDNLPAPKGIIEQHYDLNTLPGERKTKLLLGLCDVAEALGKDCSYMKAVLNRVEKFSEGGPPQTKMPKGEYQFTHKSFEQRLKEKQEQRDLIDAADRLANESVILDQIAFVKNRNIEPFAPFNLLSEPLLPHLINTTYNED